MFAVDLREGQGIRRATEHDEPSNVTITLA